MSKTFRDPHFIAACFLTVANVGLIWVFRFLPLYDLPMFLYEVHLMREIANPVLSHVYEIITLPTPNLGFVGIVYVFSFFSQLEVAGKLFLSLCVAGLPWSYRYSVRAISGHENSWAEYVAFPFSFCLYFFSGQAFFFGLTMLFWSIGFLHTRWNKASTPILLSGLFLAMYFVHALIVLLAALVALGYALNSDHKAKRVAIIAAAGLPTLLCAIIYSIYFSSPEAAEARWSFWVLAQNVFKSLFVITRSYGVVSPVSPTLINAIWLTAVMVVIIVYFRLARKQSVVATQFVLPIVASAILMLVLPGALLGVVQPGARFGLPLLLFMILLTARGSTHRGIKTVSLAVSILVVLYNSAQFSRVNGQMQPLFADIQSIVTTDETFAVVRFDWPSERNWQQIGAASIDPMFGAIYYAQLEHNGIGAIFGTALLRTRPQFKELKPLFSGTTRQEFANSIIAQRHRFNCFRYLVLVGKNKERDTFAATMENSGFELKKKSEFWTIMRSTATNPMEYFDER